MDARILVIAEVFPPRMGGSGRWLWELYRRLPPGTVHVAAGSVDGDDAFDRGQTMPVTRLPLRFTNWGLLHLSSSLEYRRANRRLDAIADVATPDIIHCAKAVPEGVLGGWLARRRGVPFWCYVHGEELTLARTSRELRFMTSQVLARSERVVANSAHTRELLVRDWRVPAERIVVVHPGVDTDRFVPAPRDLASRSRLGWTDRTVILTVGALQKRKGQDMVIKAIPLLREEFPSVLYCIAGEGWEDGYLRALARTCGVEEFVQFRGIAGEGELVECYQQCDVFALPNRQVGWDFEGFGIVLLEAQACARPVLTGRSGGTAEAIDDGRSGVLGDCTSPKAVADALAPLLRDRAAAERMGVYGRQWVRERFDWSHAAAQAGALFTASHADARGRRPA